MNHSKRRVNAEGDRLPTIRELRQFNLAADNWLAARGEYVGGMSASIRRDLQLFITRAKHNAKTA